MQTTAKTFSTLLPSRFFRAGIMAFEVSFMLVAHLIEDLLYAPVEQHLQFQKGMYPKRDIENICQALAYMIQKLKLCSEQPRLAVILEQHYSRCLKLFELFSTRQFIHHKFYSAIFQSINHQSTKTRTWKSLSTSDHSFILSLFRYIYQRTLAK